MKKTSFAALALALTVLLAPAAAKAACPDGNYAVKGWNPGVATSGNASYTGTVSIKAVGEVCQLDWKIGSQVFGGVGTYDAATKMLNIAYGELKAGWFGLVYYKDAGSVLNGQWVVYGDKTGRLGTEILTKQ